MLPASERLSEQEGRKTAARARRKRARIEGVFTFWIGGVKLHKAIQKVPLERS